jgi:hypothetical protein
VGGAQFKQVAGTGTETPALEDEQGRGQGRSQALQRNEPPKRGSGTSRKGKRGQMDRLVAPDIKVGWLGLGLVASTGVGEWESGRDEGGEAANGDD